MIHRINRPQFEFYIAVNYCVAYYSPFIIPKLSLVERGRVNWFNRLFKWKNVTLCAISKWNELFRLIFPIVCFEIVYILCKQQLNGWKQQKNGLKKLVFESATPCRIIVINVASQHICHLILSIILTACFSFPLNSSIVYDCVIHVSYDYHTYFRTNTKWIDQLNFLVHLWHISRLCPTLLNSDTSFHAIFGCYCLPLSM